MRHGQGEEGRQRVRHGQGEEGRQRVRHGQREEARQRVRHGQREWKKFQGAGMSIGHATVEILYTSKLKFLLAELTDCCPVV